MNLSRNNKKSYFGVENNEFDLHIKFWMLELESLRHDQVN